MSKSCFASSLQQNATCANSNWKSPLGKKKIVEPQLGILVLTLFSSVLKILFSQLPHNPFVTSKPGQTWSGFMWLLAREMKQKGEGKPLRLSFPQNCRLQSLLVPPLILRRDKLPVSASFMRLPGDAQTVKFPSPY